MSTKKPTVYSLTISLNDWSPRIWRRLWVRGDTKLDHLSYILFSSMGWCGYHLSAIIAHDVWYTDLSIDDPSPDWKDWEEFVLDDIVKDGLTQFQYAYDFGDNWNMTVKVKRSKNLDRLAPYPVCVSGKNAGPPEDVGSYPGFDRFIKVMRNKKHRDYKELSEWWGEDSFDPSYFSTDEVNSLIRDQKDFEEYVNEKLG